MAGPDATPKDDAFASPPPTPTDPRFFGVTIPAGTSLTVVVNPTSNADAVPEPSTRATISS